MPVYAIDPIKALSTILLALKNIRKRSIVSRGGIVLIYLGFFMQEDDSFRLDMYKYRTKFGVTVYPPPPIVFFSDGLSSSDLAEKPTSPRLISSFMSHFYSLISYVKNKLYRILKCKRK